MARIPLAEIPNAPRIGSDPQQIGVPQVNTNLGRAAQSLLTPTLEADAFSGEAKGLAHLGRSGEKVAAVLQDWQETKVRADDAIGMAKIDSARAQFVASLAEKNAGQPESQWVKGFDDALPEYEKTSAGFSLSRAARERLRAEDIRWAGETRARISLQATQRQFERGGQEIISAYRRNVDEGNYEQAENLLSGGVSAGLVADRQAQGLRYEASEMTRQKSLLNEMEAHPRQFHESVKELVATGKSDVLKGRILSQEEARSWDQRAQKHWRGVQAASRSSFFSRIYDRDITREDQLAGASENLDEADVAAGRIAMSNWDADLDYDKYGELRGQVAAYLSANDADGSGLAALEREIALHVPGQHASRLVKQLHDRAANPKADGRLSGYFQKVEGYVRSGLLGDTGRDAQGKIVDPQKAQLIGQKAEVLRSEIERFIQKNPDASSREVNQKIREHLKSTGATSRAADALRDRGIRLSP